MIIVGVGMSIPARAGRGHYENGRAGEPGLC